MKTLKLNAAVAALAAILSAAPARADLADVSKAMGTPDNVQYSGSGLMFGIGQAYRPGLPWPKLNLPRYMRVDDYANSGQSFDYTMNRADQLGGTAVPPRGDVRRSGGVVGDQAWTINFPATDPTQAAATPLQHDLWISPHGIVKAAMADRAVMNGSTFAIERAGKFKARATVDAQNLIARVESWIDNPVLGDMAVVTTYSDYKDYNGVKFPGRITQSMGGNPVLELAVSEVKINAGAVTAPAQIGRVASEVKIDKIADGVWFVTGGSHNTVAIEMRDHIVLYDAPLGDGRMNPVIQAVKDAVPNKPIRMAVASHHHFDHSGGLRAAAAEGATIMLPVTSAWYFEQAYAAPRTLNPDSLTKSGKQAKIESFTGDKHLITDGLRTIELHLIKDNVHADGFVMAYLPKEKILMLADAFSPRAAITQTPPSINPSTAGLWDNIQRLKLDVDTVLPIHGRAAKLDDLKMEVGAR